MELIRNDTRRLSQPSALARLSRVVVACAMTLGLLLNALPAPAAPTAQAASVAADGKGPARPVKSKMHTRFAATPLAGTDCSSQSAPPSGITKGPKIYNCYVRGVTASSATIMWESDAQATATLCFNTMAYPDYACTAAGVNAFCQTVNPNQNPGTSIPNNEIASQQIPAGNWLYTANISVNAPGTYHYQISLQTGSAVMTSSADATFATPGAGGSAFHDNFYGTGEAASPYFTENWPGGGPAGSGSVLFQDKFNTGSTLSSSWNIVSGTTWAVNARAGVATTSTNGQADETVALMGAGAGTEITTSITLPPITAKDYFKIDEAGIGIFDNTASTHGGFVWLDLFTDSSQIAVCPNMGQATGMPDAALAHPGAPRLAIL